MANYEQILTSDKPTPKVRDERIDSIKYWLIVLVIAGHVFMRPEFSHSTACVVAWKWIYIFHMPLFIFISGYFSIKKKWKDLWPSIWKLLEPLIVFQAIAIITEIIIKGSTSFYSILTPWWVLWYLLSLIYWRILLQIIPNRILNNTKLLLFITFCISILSGFLPFNRFLSIQRTLSFMPFFFLGYYMRGKNIYLPNKYKPLSFLFLILMISVPLFFPRFLGSLTHADPYGNAYGALKRMITFGLAIFMSIAFINTCYNTTRTAQQGRFTMQYYIYHALAIPPLMILVDKSNIHMSAIYATIISITIIAGIELLLYLPYFRQFTNPSTFKKEVRID